MPAYVAAAPATNNPAPGPDAFGSFGTDPITGAPIMDKDIQQKALAAYANPHSLQSHYLRSMQQPMLPGRSGGGGGGGGRMGPQDQRKIMNLGSRTTAEYTAKHGGLSPQRPSTLDAAYARGDFGNWNPDSDVQRETDPFRYNKPLDPAFAKDAPTPMEQGGGYNLPPTAFDKPAEEVKALAKGGPMHPGKPYLVGEEGPELIMPRQNGDGFVLPADVTAQILPTMRAPTPRKNGGKMAYTPRAEGGPMTLQSPSGRFAAITGDYGTGFATRIPASDGIDLMATDTPRMMFDPATAGRYQLNMDAPGLPLAPDTIEGPFAEPAAPVTPAMRADLTQATAGRAQALAMAPGTIPQSRYPGQLFQDAAFDARTSRYDAMRKQTPEEKRAASAQGTYALSDPFVDSADTHLTFEELRDRVALRGMMYGDDFRDRNARNQTQLDLAARANRAPVGTPTAPVSQIPGMPAMRPSTQRAIDRNQERFLRTPEGAAMMLGNAQRQAELQQRTQLAATAIPVTDPATGQILGYTTGTGASLPNMNRPRTVQRTAEIDGQFYNFFDDGTAEPIANVPKAPPKQIALNTLTNQTLELPPGITADQLPPGFTLLGPKATPEIGGAKTDPKNPAAQPKAVTSQADYEALPAGATYTFNGKTYTKKA